jgi:hypothetical protein
VSVAVVPRVSGFCVSVFLCFCVSVFLPPKYIPTKGGSFWFLLVPFGSFWFLLAPLVTFLVSKMFSVGTATDYHTHYDLLCATLALKHKCVQHMLQLQRNAERDSNGSLSSSVPGSLAAIFEVTLSMG